MVVRFHRRGSINPGGAGTGLLRNGESLIGVAAAGRAAARKQVVRGAAAGRFRPMLGRVAASRSCALCVGASIPFWRLIKFVANEGRMELSWRRAASAAGRGMRVPSWGAAGARAGRRSEGRLQGGE